MAINIPLKVCELLGRIDPKVQLLLTTSSKLYTLQKLVRQHLPASLANHCHLANYKEFTLLLHADSSAWASRIRLESPQLQNKLIKFQEFKGIHRIIIHVTKVQPIAGREPVRLKLSLRSGAVINELADNIDIPELATALKRLARRAQTP